MVIKGPLSPIDTTASLLGISLIGNIRYPCTYCGRRNVPSVLDQTVFEKQKSWQSCLHSLFLRIASHRSASQTRESDRNELVASDGRDLGKQLFDGEGAYSVCRLHLFTSSRRAAE